MQSRFVGLLAFASMLSGCAATTSGAPPTGLGGDKERSKENITYSQEKQRAFETLTGLKFPAVATEVAEYCDKIAPPVEGVIASVAGYADDRACRRLHRCARPLAEGGYHYVEVEFTPLRSVPTASLSAGKYKIYLSDIGDPACATYNRYINNLNDEERRRATRPPVNKCFALAKISTFSSKYTVSESREFNIDVGDFRHVENKTIIKDTKSGDVVVASKRIIFGSRDLDPDWYISCSNKSERESFVRSVLPPIR
ncbi:hypothetical protein [Hyphococcus sp.]|uniref:hypothetical protein n=1 Tax=Hyphococcus sp. TaxID=2038636 RepID=UPI003CCC364B